MLVSIRDTDFLSPSVSGFGASYGGTTDGAIDLSFIYDENNGATGGQTFASGDHDSSVSGTTAFSNEVFADLPTLSRPFALEIRATINHQDGTNLSSFDAAIAPVPLPASAWLFGSIAASCWVGRKKLARRA